MKHLVIACVAFWGSAHLAAAQASVSQLTADGVDVSIDLDAGQFSVGSEPLMSWVRRALHIVTGYYSRFPTSSLRIRVVPEPGGGVITGKTFGYRGGYIRVEVGRDVTEAQLTNDWVLVHEMTHLALPDVGDEHAWLSEGLAVYIEGIAREQAGNRTQQDIFAEEMRSMPRGLPESGDRGLDHTHSWGRTYWGGAIFCLLADVNIHRQTHNRFGLQDAVRAVAEQSGGLVTDWPIERVLAAGDAATGTTVLADLYAEMKDKPVSPDLPKLWRELGVELHGGTIVLDDTAPLAPVRAAIMQPRVSRAQS